MPNNDMMYALVHLDWNNVIVLDTSPKAFESLKYVFNINNLYEKVWDEKGDKLVQGNAYDKSKFPKIEIISREEFANRTKLETANDNAESRVE